MALKLLSLLPNVHRSVVIPDKRAATERLDSIATIQRRLQEMLDEGRMLRQQIEVVSGNLDFPLTRGADGDPRVKKIPPERGHARRRKTDLED